MSSSDLNLIKPVHESSERLFKVAESIPLEQLFDQVQAHFDITSDSSLELIDINVNITIVPTLITRPGRTIPSAYVSYETFNGLIRQSYKVRVTIRIAVFIYLGHLWLNTTKEISKYHVKVFKK
jgi:hypothetical protein